MRLNCFGFTLLFMCTRNAWAAVYDDGRCPLLALLPFEVDKLPGPAEAHRAPKQGRLKMKQYNQWRPDLAAHQSVSYMAAAMLAVRHFNERNSQIVPQLATLNSCNVTIPEVVVRNSNFDPATSIRTLYETTALFKKLSQGKNDFPCALLGPVDGKALTMVSANTEAFHMPQLNFYSETDMVLRGPHPSVVSNTLVQATRAEMVASYLQMIERQYVAATFTTRPEEMWLGLELPAAGRKIGLRVSTFEMEDSVEAAFRRIKKTGIRTILFSNMWPSAIVHTAAILQDLGMLTDDYVYILSHKAVSTRLVGQVYGEQPIGSPLDKLLNGALVFDRVDPFELHPETDPFLKAWRQQGSDFVDQLNAQNPILQERQSDANSDFPAAAPPDYFQTNLPAKYASQVYDSIMALGFGSCSLQEQLQGGRSGEQRPPPGPSSLPPPPQDGPPPPQDEPPKKRRPLPPHVASILRSQFDGASGPVRFGAEQPQARSSTNGGITFGAYNIRPTPANESGMRSYEAVLTSIWIGEDAEEASRTDPLSSWKTIDPFVYSSGSMDPPSVVLEVFVTNYLSSWVRLLGLILFAMAWLLAFGGMASVWLLRKDASVRKSQPIFLQLLCLGSATLSTAILTMSWDEGIGWSDSQLDIACTLTPWFFFIGQIVAFSAMFTKLWRVDKVMQWRRRKVTVVHVIGPLVVLLLMSLVVLALWTVLDPWTWERELIADVSPSESYGECRSDHFWAFFGPLMGLLIVSESVTIFFAWKTSDIQQDLSDSKQVLFAIATHLQAWAVGVPILTVLGNSSSDATYLGRVFLIWIFSISSVLIIIGPKVYSALQLRGRELAKPGRNASAGNKVRIWGLRATLLRSKPQNGNWVQWSWKRKPSEKVATSATSASSGPRPNNPPTSPPLSCEEV